MNPRNALVRERFPETVDRSSVRSLTSSQLVLHLQAALDHIKRICCHHLRFECACSCVLEYEFLCSSAFLQSENMSANFSHVTTLSHTANAGPRAEITKFAIVPILWSSPITLKPLLSFQVPHETVIIVTKKQKQLIHASEEREL